MTEFFDRYDCPSFNVRSKGSGCTLRLSVYQGNTKFTIWGSDNGGKLYDKSTNPDLLTIIKGRLVKIISAGPNTKLPILCQKYDPENKKFVPDCTIIIHKNESGVISLDIQWVNENQTNKDSFILCITGGISVDSEPMSDADRSLHKVNSLISFITHDIPYARVLTKRKYQPNKRTFTTPPPSQNSNKQEGVPF